MINVQRVSASPTRTHSFWSQALGLLPATPLCWETPSSIDSAMSFIISPSSSPLRRLLQNMLCSSSQRQCCPDLLTNSWGPSHVTRAHTSAYPLLFPPPLLKCAAFTCISLSLSSLSLSLSVTYWDTSTPSTPDTHTHTQSYSEPGISGPPPHETMYYRTLQGKILTR